MAIINLRHRFGWYEPSLTGMFQKKHPESEKHE